MSEIQQPDLCWYALTVKPQHEKATAIALRRKGFEEFVPLYRSLRKWSDRVKNLDLPLFPGYVFCRFALDNRLGVLTAPGVNSIVGAGRQPAPVSGAEIEAIRAMVSSGLPVEPWPFIEVGQRVRIEGGSLDGLEGILTQVRNCWRVVVNVELLRRSVAVEIERDRVFPLRKAQQAASAAGPPAGARGLLSP